MAAIKRNFDAICLDVYIPRHSELHRNRLEHRFAMMRPKC